MQIALGKVVGGRYQLSSSDKERITNLEVSQTRMGAYDEQKSAASLEMSAIRRFGSDET
jgi:hypothetical protein